jgi:hypothetical protein
MSEILELINKGKYSEALKRIKENRAKERRSRTILFDGASIF